MVRKYTDVQATRDIQRAEALVARQRGLQPRGDHRALRGHAESAGLSLHAAALAVLSSDPVLPRPAVPHQPAVPHRSTGREREVRPAGTAPQELDPLGMERLCVAARAVLAQRSDLDGAVGTETDRARLREHAEVLADLDRLSSLSPAEVATHAGVVRDALTALASDEALGIAVWFDDVLGSGAPVAAPIGA
jgi:hypothetical protein